MSEDWLVRARQRREQEQKQVSSEEDWLASARKRREQEQEPASAEEDWLVRARQRRYDEDAQKVDDSYIDTFFNDAMDFLDGNAARYTGLNWGNASTTYQDVSASWTDLDYRRNVVQKWLELNKDYLDQTYFNDASELLKTLDSDAQNHLAVFKNEKDYYSQWETEEAYNSYQEAENLRHQMMEEDLGLLEKEIQDLEKQRDSFEYDWTDNRQREAAEAHSEEYNKQISAKRQYYNKAKLLQEGAAMSDVVNNDDFREYSGYASTESGKWYDFITTEKGMGYNDLTYEYINNQNGIREEIDRRFTAQDGATIGGADSKFEYRSLSHMTAEEVAIYNYHYAKNGREAAERYLDTIQEDLNARKAYKTSEELKGQTASQILYGYTAGWDQFDSGLKSLFNTDSDYIPTSYVQLASGMVREDLGQTGPKLPQWLGGASLGQMGYDAVNTTSHMLPSIFASSVSNALVPGSGAYVGNALTFASSAGNSYQEALNMGYSKEQARSYSTLVGASEAGLQYFLGGISKLGGKVSGSAISKMMSGIDSALGKAALQLTGSMLSEGMEEGLQEIMTTWFKNLTLHAGEDINWEEVAYSSLMGMLTSGIMEIGGSTLNKVVSKGQGTQSREGSAPVGAEGIQQRTDGVDVQQREDAPGPEAPVSLYEDAPAVQETAAEDPLWALAQEVAADQREAENAWQSDLEGAETATDAREDIGGAREQTQSEGLYEAVEDAPAVQGQQTAEAASDPVWEAAHTVVREARQQQEALAEELAADMRPETAGKESPLFGRYTGIREIQKGKVLLDTANGDVADSSQLSVSQDAGSNTFKLVSSLSDKIDIPTANELCRQLEFADDLVGQSSMRGMEQAYNYGYAGYARSAMEGDHTMAALVPEAVRNILYDMGAQYRQTVESEKAKSKTTPKPKTDQNVKPAEADSGKHRGPDESRYEKVRFEGEITRWGKKQRAEVEFVEFVAKNFSGNRVYVYESYMNADGKYVYTDSAGRVQKAHNGVYVEKNGDIYLDLNAGNHSEGLVLNTFAHELYHHVEKQAPEQAKALAEFIAKELGEENVEAAVNRQIEKARNDNHGEKFFMKEMGMSAEEARQAVRDRAYSDFIADGLETMFTKGDVVQKLADLHRQDKGLFHSIRKFIRKWVSKLREFYNAGNTLSIEGRQVAELETFDKIQQMFAEALKIAGENYRTAEKNTAGGGGVKYSLRVKRTNGLEALIDPEEITQTEILDYLDMARRGQLENYTYFPVSAHTPGVLVATLHKAGVEIIDKPLAMQARKARQSQLDETPYKKGGTTVRHHAMKPQEILQAINKLGTPDAIIHQRDRTKVVTIDGEKVVVDAPDNFAVFVTLNSGKECVAVIEFDSEIDSKYLVKDGHGDAYHTTVTVFEPDVIRDGEPFDYIEYLLLRPANCELEIEKESSKTETAYSETHATVSEIELSNKKITQQHNEVKKNSSRDTVSVSNRSLLANALDSVAQDESEKRRLAEYREAIEKLEGYEKELAGYKEKLAALEGSKKPRDVKERRRLKDEAIKTANRIDIYDKKLLRLEGEKPLERVLKRERQRVLKEMQKKYGTIKHGEKAVRDDSLPVSTDGKNKVSLAARTVKGAGVTTDELADAIDAEVVQGGLTYIPLTNNKTTQKAREWLENEGWEDALREWHDDVIKCKSGADMFARGAVLLNNAAQAGNKKVWRDILYDYQFLNTTTAQGLQASRILKQLQPEDNLYMVRRSIKQMVKDMRLQVDIQLNEELVQAYQKAKTEEERDAIMAQIQQDVADQIPSTFMDKWTALRYVNMLGNLRTQGRNVIGNVAMMATTRFKDMVAVGLEQIAYKASGGKFNRTKALANNRALLKAAKKDFDVVESLVLGGGKYNDQSAQSAEFAKAVLEKRRIFKNKLLEGYRKLTNWAMDKGDVIFSKAAYGHALANYLQAHGVKTGDFSAVDPALLDDARVYAVQQAQEATFRDTNTLSGWVSTLGRKPTTPVVGRVLSEGTVPFRKTPANMLVRAEEYSPMGILNSLGISLHGAMGHSGLVNNKGFLGKIAKSGEQITGAQIVESWAKTITGTGLFALGMLLRNIGVLIGGPDDDEKLDKFEDLNGQQNYAFHIGDMYFTVDFLSPSVIPMFMGAQMLDLYQENGFQFKDLESAFTSLADPMVEMSMLQGLNDTLENVQYAENNLMQIAISASLSYLTQGLTNSMLGQIERGVEGSRRSTYVDKDGAVPGWLQSALGKASAKTPVWDYNQIPFINAWGEEEENPTVALNLIYNMLSPSYISKETKDIVSQELTRLNEVQSDVNVFPSTPEKEYDGRYLTAEEYVALARTQGQTQRQIIEKMVDSSLYDGLPDAYKAKAVSLAYQYAKESAQIEELGREGFSSDWMAEIKGNTAEGIVKHVIKENIKNMYLSGDISADEAVKRRIEYHGDTEDEAAEKIAYWDFQDKNPEYADWNESTVTRYKDLAPETAAHVVDVLGKLEPEEGSSTVRTIQKMETITGDSKLSDEDKDIALRAIMDDKLEAKYNAARDLEIGRDTFVLAYRKYLDTEGKGKKKAILDYFQNTLKIGGSEAKELYDLFNGKEKE